ncbi:MAG: HEAT repeat domain-containing protein, partial [Kofleriaceae bacterium]
MGADVVDAMQVRLGPALSTMPDLLGESRRVRLRAVRSLPETTELSYALRRVLFSDPDAKVRAAAAYRLGTIGAPAIAGWLTDALDDRSLRVRGAIVRALANCGDTASRSPLRDIVSGDRVWWLRRSAVYALAAIAGSDELDVLRQALADPYWRVRQAAVDVLARLGAHDLSVREAVARDADQAAVGFLRASWGPAAVTSPARTKASSRLPGALRDADPAVITARLARDPALAAPPVLIELLADPHPPLRALASDLIERSGDLAAYRSALDWLELPRIPYGADTVERLLDRLGARGAELATWALARSDRPGATRWAIRWVVATKSDELYEAVVARARTDRGLRRGAIRIASIADLVAWADRGLLDAIAAELFERGSRDAHTALLGLDAATHHRTRRLQIDAAARRDLLAVVERGLTDAHYEPRAVAVRHLRWPAGAFDHDPAVREAALDASNACDLIGDPDPWVADAATRGVARVRAVTSIEPVARPRP